MTCDFCPFLACSRCEFQGGKAPVPQRDTGPSECDEFVQTCDNGSVDEDGPGGCANTLPRPNHRLNSRLDQEDSVATPEPTPSPSTAHQKHAVR